MFDKMLGNSFSNSVVLCQLETSVRHQGIKRRCIKVQTFSEDLQHASLKLVK